MDQAPPLEELAARKRLIQAKMELHRAEMAVYLHEVTRPFHSVSHGFSRVVSNPMVRLGAVGLVGYLLVRGRRRLASKGENWLASLIVPQLKKVVVGLALKVAFKYVRSSFALR